MIINHTYKFIFLKTRKTAGTSIEIALSRFCGETDVVTAISQEDELKRKEPGYTGPQNFYIPIQYYRNSDWLTLFRKRFRKRFTNHANASYIRDNVSGEIWSSYYKFCFERNPFDKAISTYYWSKNDPRQEITEYLDSVPTHLLSNWHIYSTNDRISVDFVGRYENIENDLATIAQKLKLPGDLFLPRAKGQYRKNREHYSRILDECARARVELVCAKELTAFNYHWEDPHNS